MTLDERGPSRPIRPDTGVPRSALIRRLGEGPELQGGDLPAALDGLARSDLPVLEGMVLSPKAYEEFLRGSGLLTAVRSCAAAGDSSRQALTLRRAYASAPVGEVMHELTSDMLLS